MSAAELFNGHEDAVFRLNKTFLVFGKTFVKVTDMTYDSKGTQLLLRRGHIDRWVALADIPLHVMAACPQGYFEEGYFTRGPDRNRYQGLLASSFHYRDTLMGGVYPNFKYSCEEVLCGLLSQKGYRTESVAPKKGQVLTNQVRIGHDHELIWRGLNVGVHEGRGKCVLHEWVDSEFVTPAIERAKLKIVA